LLAKAGYTEIRWHGRGGQGAKTAALLLAEAAAEAGLHVQGFPEYGPERMGAPVLAFNRISPDPIRLHCHVQNPDVVAVLDPTLLGRTDDTAAAGRGVDGTAAAAAAGGVDGITAGLRRSGVVVVNSGEDPSLLRERLGLGRRPRLRVATVDAGGISLKALGQAIPNTPMVAAVIRLTDLLDFDRFLDVAARLLQLKFGRNPHLVDGNLKAMERAYREVREG